MSINRFAKRYWLALLLVGLHTLLIGLWAWIELDDAWNDMNPTMLVQVAFYVADWPIHWVLHPWIDSVARTGTYLAATLALGTLFWFAVGVVLTAGCRALWRLRIWRRPAAGGA